MNGQKVKAMRNANPSRPNPGRLNGGEDKAWRTWSANSPEGQEDEDIPRFPDGEPYGVPGTDDMPPERS